MTTHALTEGRIEVHETSGKVVLELWNGRSSEMELKGREDAAVLRYIAGCLEHFADTMPEEEEEPEEKHLTKSPPNIDQGSDKKEPRIVAGGSPALNSFALR